ncbi:hypothetical protein F4779DRAFT_597114 [Xylariaceae sp. FL0662B]|nr:hypothetical protein F4779DRAFT_597114 [Xylariaceae sp. FL0662B]
MAMTSHNVAPTADFVGQVDKLLNTLRGVELNSLISTEDAKTPLQALMQCVTKLQSSERPREAEAFQNVLEIAQTPPDYGGLGLDLDSELDEKDAAELDFLISAWLESLNSADKVHKGELAVVRIKPPGRPPMTLTEKIFAIHDIEPKGYVRTGETIRVSVDWIMASEATWGSMEQTYENLGEPGVFRNDRFWLAGDHLVDPRVNDTPKVAKVIKSIERAKKVFKMTEYQGMNYTIMHTEFYRERAQPGMLIIGSDSHTCSSGANGCLAIGLGGADVTMGLVTGTTWFKVPEVANIRFIGKPARGVGGKDVILYVLQQLKRNTVAADRVVEYTGPGLKYLSPDARFAVANMTTELGGITGIFVPDHVTKSFIDSRKVARHRNGSHYFRPDDDAVYAESHEVDLSKAEPSIAKYPNPDDVVAVTEALGMELDGCFIGACTTAEEDIILGALVLEQGLKNGLRPISKGKRKVVPGSRPITDKLRKTGLAEVYEKAGFEIGIPGCSYCVGMSADKAGEGEVWLSSQNRNFENRMGPGAIGNLASAATVAASSFSMKITNPQRLVDQIDPERWESLKGKGSLRTIAGPEPDYVEPASPPPSPPPATKPPSIDKYPSPNVQSHSSKVRDLEPKRGRMIRGKVFRLGDFIDTDALAPAQFLIGARTNEELGAHCLEFTHPDFRQRVADGYNIVVAGKAFGCGSSREHAVLALLGCGVQCVIAKSFAFIYSRNQPSLGLLGIALSDDSFFEAARFGTDIEIDEHRNVVRVHEREFPFQLSGMEKELVNLGGVTPAFMKFGKQMFEALCSNVHTRGSDHSQLMQW